VLYSLSPAQASRLESLQDRYPATTFDVVSVDDFSRVAIVEGEDLAGFSYFAIAANGRAVSDTVALDWASTH
jgi:hypothetical protein